MFSCVPGGGQKFLGLWVFNGGWGLLWGMMYELVLFYLVLLERPLLRGSCCSAVL